MVVVPEVNPCDFAVTMMTPGPEISKVTAFLDRISLIHEVTKDVMYYSAST
jgi:hypothetical protein